MSTFHDSWEALCSNAVSLAILRVLYYVWCLTVGLSKWIVHYITNAKGSVEYLIAHKWDKKECFSSATTAEEICQHFAPFLSGKVIFVTGATDGIGKALVHSLIATSLQSNDCQMRRLVITYRNETKLSALRNELAHKNKVDSDVISDLLKPIYCDLASLESVDNCAKEFLELDLPLHILVNNAGLVSINRSLTADKFESMFGVNYVSHFYLCLLLYKKLRSSAPSRVVNVASIAQIFTNGINFTDIDGDRFFNGMERYGHSKLANCLHTRELNKRLQKESSHITCNVCHPGYISQSGLYRGLGDFRLRMWPFSKTNTQGAASIAYAMLHPKYERRGGRFIVDCREIEFPSLSNAKDGVLAKKLWTKTLELIRDKYKPIDLD